jgi:hypothetical protein
MMCVKEAKLMPVQMLRCQFEAHFDDAASVEQFDIGQVKRHMVDLDGVEGGINPRYLNASSYLEVLIAVGENVKSRIEGPKRAGGVLARAAGKDSVSVATIVPADTDAAALQGTRLTPDRYCEFDKKDLIDFASTIEHSIAVTEKKLSHGQALEA